MNKVTWKKNCVFLIVQLEWYRCKIINYSSPRDLVTVFVGKWSFKDEARKAAMWIMSSNFIIEVKGWLLPEVLLHGPCQSSEGVSSWTTMCDKRSEHAEASTLQQLSFMQNLTDGDKGANATFCVIWHMSYFLAPREYIRN